MKMTTGTWVISFMLTTIVVLLLNVSNVTGAVCCNAYGSTINCTPNSTAFRPWTLCEILFPSEPSCPGDTPRPNITSLLLGSSGLRNLSRYALHRLPRLETLDLRNNHLSRFPRVQTGWLPNSVLKLDVSYNSLEALPRYAFRGLVKLVLLLLNNNQIMTMSAGTFVGNPKLKVLDLSFNRLRSIVPGMLRWLKTLTVLNLNNNFLRMLSRASFSDLVALKVLCLKNNFLTIIPDIVLKPLRHLETLNLKNNLLYELDISTLVSLKQISYLDVSMNSLPFNNATLSDYIDPSYQMTIIISIAAGLRTLKISSAFRPVSVLPPFVEFRPSANSLRSLDVSGTSFASCSLTFLGLVRLTSLDISGGNCTIIGANVFEHLPNLRNLSMSNMRLDADQFHSHSSCLFSELSKLESLDLSRNHLFFLDAGMLRFQTHLKTLNLSWNCFHTLPLELAHLHVLKVLDLSHNVFLTLNPSDRMVLSGMVGNLSLNLNGNPFSCTCSNEDFFGWWSSKFQIQATSVEDSRLSAGPKAELRCVSGRGGSMSVKHLLENCAADSLGFSTGLKVLVCVVSLVVVVLVVVVIRVKGYRHCGKTDSESGIEMQTRPSQSFPAERQRRYRNEPYTYHIAGIGEASGEDSSSGPDESVRLPTQRCSRSQRPGLFQTTVDIDPRFGPSRSSSQTSSSAEPVQPGQRHSRRGQVFSFLPKENEMRHEVPTDWIDTTTSSSSEPNMFGNYPSTAQCLGNPLPNHHCREQRYTASSCHVQDLVSSSRRQHHGERNDGECSSREGSIYSDREYSSREGNSDMYNQNWFSMHLSAQDCAGGSSISDSNPASETQVKMIRPKQNDLCNETGGDPYKQVVGYPELPRELDSSFQDDGNDGDDKSVDFLNILNPSTDSSLCPSQFHPCVTDHGYFLYIQNPSSPPSESSSLSSLQSYVSSSVEDMALLSVENDSSLLTNDDLGESFETAASLSSESDSELPFQTADISPLDNTSESSFHTATSFPSTHSRDSIPLSSQ